MTSNPPENHLTIKPKMKLNSILFTILITGAICVAFPTFDFSFLVPEFRDRLARELDFTWEGRSCERTGKALADDARMVTPKIHWSLTTGRVLTMEYVRGVKVDDGPGLRAAGEFIFIYVWVISE